MGVHERRVLFGGSGQSPEGFEMLDGFGPVPEAVQSEPVELVELGYVGALLDEGAERPAGLGELFALEFSCSSQEPFMSFAPIVWASGTSEFALDVGRYRRPGG